MKKLLILLFLLLLLPSCGEDDTRPTPVLAPTSQSTADQLAADKKMQDQIAALRGDNDSKVKTIQEAQDRIEANNYIILAAQESNKKLQGDVQNFIVVARKTKIYWLSGILGFAALGLIVLAVFVPYRRDLFIKLAGVATALACVLLYVAKWAAYFETIGLVFLILLVAFLIFELATHSQALQKMIAAARAYAAHVPADVKAGIDKANIDSQAAHVKSFLDKVLAFFHKI